MYFDCVTIMREYFPNAQIDGQGEWIKIPCPFCSTLRSHLHHKHFLFTNAKTGYSHCFACNYKESNMLKTLSNIGIKVSFSLKDQIFSLINRPTGKILSQSVVVPTNQLTHFGLVPLSKSIKGIEFFEKRGFTEKDINNTMYFGEHPSTDNRFLDSIVFTCYPNGLSGRNIHNKQFKTYQPHPGAGMFYLPQPLDPEEHSIVIVEDPFSANKLTREGWNTLALLKKNLPPKINTFLKQKGITDVYIWLDPDAISDSFKLIQTITRPNRYVVDYHKEPDDTPSNEISDVLEQTTEYNYEQFTQWRERQLDSEFDHKYAQV